MLQPTEKKLLDLDVAFLNSILDGHVQLLRLMSCEAFNYSNRTKNLPLCGIYLFSEDKIPLYVGRSNNLRQRITNHCGANSKHDQSAFAFKLAREISGHTKVSYSGSRTRKKLMEDEFFLASFGEAKARISRMDIRFFEESDQIRQAILEIYCSIALRTPYNQFGTH